MKFFSFLFSDLHVTGLLTDGARQYGRYRNTSCSWHVKPKKAVDSITIYFEKLSLETNDTVIISEGLFSFFLFFFFFFLSLLDFILIIFLFLFLSYFFSLICSFLSLFSFCLNDDLCILGPLV